jgi:Skp family chaperone for outer membrane proteins
MTDYLAGLNRSRQNYIDSRTGQDTGVSLSGLGAPTPRKVTEFIAENTDNPVAIAQNILYERDNADYAGDTFQYELRSGDTLSELALKYNMSVPEILRLNKDNPAIRDKDMIYAGGTINLTKPKDTDIIIPTATDDRFEGSNLNVIMNDLAKKYDLPYNFIKAVATQESGLKYRKGALDEEGIMQVRPIALKDVNKYYKEFKGNPITMDQLTKGSGSYNIQRSVEAGVAYLAMLRDKYGAESLKDIATMYNGGPNAVRSGNKKAMNYANSVLNIMETIEPFKFDSFKKDKIEESTLNRFDVDYFDQLLFKHGFEKAQKIFLESKKTKEPSFLGADSFGIDELIESAELQKELNKIKTEIDRITDSSKDNTNMLQDGKKLLEEAYETIRQIEEKTVTFKDRVERSFPKDSPFVDRILDDKTEEEKQSIVARPKRFVQ